ncbi:unnamed protein product [Heterobilharzia americana]|nr:unnamed protein product [Heterobilharzia americana]
MEPFLDAFFAVDVDHSDVITTEDLRTYVERHNLDEKMVRSWKRLFDPENTGYITLEKFCEVFGIKKEEAHKIRIERMKVPVEKLGSDVYVISQQMDINDQIRISDQARRLLYPPGELGNREIAQNLKLWLQKVYGPTWHVVVLRGAYGLSYTHLENRSFQFQLQDRCFLIWGTPSEYQLV